MPPKTPLEPAGRHVAEAKAAIDRQREMIRAINAAEQSTELAETVLATMEWTLANFEFDLERLRRGRRTQPLPRRAITKP